MRENLLYQVRKTAQENNPNFVLFDIQHDQADELKKTLENKNIPILQQVPIIDLRLRKLNGKKIDEILSENRKALPEDKIPLWTLMRTYRCTYQDKILNSEKLLDGKFTPSYDENNDTGPIPVSIEQRIMKRLKLKIGDTVEFELSGIEIPCVITSVREVEWMQMRPNFFFVFPDGPLNEAPQMQVIVSRAATEQDSVALQKTLNEKFPNVSFIDLTLVIKTVTDLLDKLSLAIRFMAGFSIFTGLIILLSTLQLSQKQRQRESALLKTLGASKRQLQNIMLSEFTSLALLSANAGCILAYVGSYLLANRIFENTPPLNFSVILYANIGLLALTITTGLLNSKKFFQGETLSQLR